MQLVARLPIGHINKGLRKEANLTGKNLPRNDSLRKQIRIGRKTIGIIHTKFAYSYLSRLLKRLLSEQSSQLEASNYLTSFTYFNDTERVSFVGITKIQSTNYGIPIRLQINCARPMNSGCARSFTGGNRFLGERLFLVVMRPLSH